MSKLHLIIFDCESELRKKQHHPILVGAWDTSHTLNIFESEDCIEQFFDSWLKHKKKKFYVFVAHNFASFDSFFVLPYLIKKKAIMLKLFIRNNNVIFIHCRINNVDFIFRDSFLHIGLPLSEIFKMFGWKKKFMEMFTKKDLLVYLCFDVIGLTRCIYGISSLMFYNYIINIFRYISIAQFAYANYKINFMRQVVYFLNQKLRRLFQPYFTGNKILITKNIGYKLFFYDVNSMYPYMMLKNLPNYYWRIEKMKNLNLFFGFVRATLLQKPQNTFYCQFTSGIIFSEELKMLIKLGYVFKIHYFLKFSRAKLFDEYINHFYHIKKFTDLKFWAYFSKISLNSLYGKFSTRVSKNNALQLSMAINSYSRVEMMYYRLKYFIYTDTDSIIYEKILPKKYISKDIGMMKLVANIKSGLFVPNYYTYTVGSKRIIKAKGMIKKISPVLESLDFQFKLAYFKRERWKIFLKETYFKFSYWPNNVVFYISSKVKEGVDWIGKLF